MFRWLFALHRNITKGEQSPVINKFGPGDVNVYYSSPRPGITSDNHLLFVTEGVKNTPEGFRIAFSIWNNQDISIKLFNISTIEHLRHYTVHYRDGQRHVFELTQEKEALWDSETYEIPPGESASFDAGYTIKTGEGDPWVVIGVVVRLHDALGNMKEIHCDAVYIIVYKQVKAVQILEIRKLNLSFRHRLYPTLLQSLLNTIGTNRRYIVDLMVEDFNVGMTKLRSLSSQQDDSLWSQQDDTDRIGPWRLSSASAMHRARFLSENIIDITMREVDAPLKKEELEHKYQLEEELKWIAIRLCGKPFIDLCAPDKSTSPNEDPWRA